MKADGTIASERHADETKRRTVRYCFCRLPSRGAKYYGEYSDYTRKGGGQLRKEGTPMSVEETIALLMLVIAAISLGIQIKK